MNIPRFFRFYPVIAAILMCSLSCQQDADPSEVPGDKTLVAKDPLLELLTAEQTGISFQNEVNQTFELNITSDINTSNGGGIGVLDANNDGLQDLYFISTTGENKLYINEGRMHFRDETSKSGLASPGGFEIAVTVVDINADGFQDIYVCRAGPWADESRRNLLFINNQDLTFTESAALYGLDDMSASTGANFFDADNDGDLDLYLLNYPSDFQYIGKIKVRPNADSTNVEPDLEPVGPYDADRLYRNDGPPKPDGTGGFTDISKQAGIWSFGYGLSVSIEDFNQDGWMDVFVSNDFIQPDILYINNQDGTFSNQLSHYFKHTSQSTMGTDLSDFDNDGLFDVLAVDMLSETQYRKKTLVNTNNQNKYTTLIRHGYFEPVNRNVLQRNNGNGTFSDVACAANVFQTDWSWSALLCDLDNDMYKDMLVANGYQREVSNMDFINFTFLDIKAKGNLKDQFTNIEDFLKLIPQYKIRNYVFQNNGNFNFTDQGGKWMTLPASWSNGAIIADLDNDGDMDYVVNNIDDPIFFYENKSTQKNDSKYLQIKCLGPGKNINAIGTKIKVIAGGVEQYTMITPNRGIFSSVELLAHFGMGTQTVAERVEITWPDGKFQVLENIPTNQRMVIQYDASLPSAPTNPAGAATLFTDATKSGQFNFTHRENDYVDFEYTFLLPWGLSDLGPLMDTADVNLDGYTDVFIGNSFGQSGGLFLQNKNGTFQKAFSSQWDQDSLYEDHGIVFFDADMDGDKDLFVVSGGYESPHPAAWQHRLYINEGQKGFIHAKGAIPLLEGVALRAAAFDYDADGDNDLIIGGRVTPGKYPSPPKSYILRNDRNKFVDVTESVAPEFQHAGMVTDLKFGNIDSDHAAELIVVGEWMQVTVFKYSQGKFEKVSPSKIGLEKSHGFWNCVELADLDADGDLDILTGNLGLNTHYRASAAFPVQCIYGDFDENGSIDPIITIYENEKCYPVIQKDVLIKQLPVMKKKFVYAKDYGTATIEDVLSPKQLKTAEVLTSEIVESGWWENTNGTFTFHSFPRQAQISPVQAMLVYDFNHDGTPDIFCAGNKYNMEVETGRIDAGVGAMLQGSGKGNLIWINNTKTGIWADRDVRDLALLRDVNDNIKIVVSNNNSPASLYLAKN